MTRRLFLAMAMAWGLAMATASAAAPADSLELERELQNLSWPRFRAVVEAIPKLRAEVDRYGPLGWQYVRANYRTHSWKKNIDRLDDEQRRQLAALVQNAKGRGTAISASVSPQVPPRKD